MDSGALPVFLRMLQHDDPKEQAATAACLWTLAFDKAVRQRIKDHEGLVAALEVTAKSEQHAVRKNAVGALWIIKGENDHSTSSSKRDCRSCLTEGRKEGGVRRGGERCGRRELRKERGETEGANYG